MMTSTSYPTAASYQQQANNMEYGYGNGNGNGNGNGKGNYHYPTATATATTGYRGSAQNAYSSYQQTSQSGTHFNPPSPQSVVYPPSQSRSKPHQLPSYGTKPMTGVNPHPTATKTAAPVQADKNQSDGEKTKQRWSFYGRSKEIETDPRDVSTSAVAGDQKESRDNEKIKHGKAKRRWSLYNRSKNETKDKTDTASVRSSPNIPARAIVPSNYYPPTEAAGGGNQQHRGASIFRPAEVHPDKVIMKQDRKAKMAGGATTGAIVGAVLTGPAWPVGAMAGAAIGSYASKVTARAGERRQQRKWEQKNFNDYLATGKAGVQREGVVLV